MIYYSQRDKRWGSIKLGTSSNTTISSHGCTITALGSILEVPPDVVNERINAVNGYADGNLVIWSKLEEAFPGIKVKRVWTYDNADVLKNVPNVLVEVDGKPIGGYRHWVVYIGNKKALDPWTGTEVPTSQYPDPLSYCVIGGKWNKPSPITDIQADLDKVREERDRNWNYFTALCNALGVTESVDVAKAEIAKLVALEDALRDKDILLNDANKKIEELDKKLNDLTSSNVQLVEHNEKLKNDALNQQITIKEQGIKISSLQDSLQDLKDSAKFSVLTGWKKALMNFISKF